MGSSQKKGMINKKAKQSQGGCNIGVIYYVVYVCK